MKISKHFVIIMCLLLLSLTNACSKSNTGDNDIQNIQQEVTLMVSAASSLTEAMEEIKIVYEEINNDVKLIYNFGSSGSLQHQIEQGAPVDVFVSAATKQMNELQDKGLLINDTRKEFLENKLVLITSKNSPSIAGFNELVSDSITRVALGEPTSVPVGQYSNEVLKNLGILNEIQSKVVYAKDVKEVLTWVETGNAQAGIVYSTDANMSNKVKVISLAPKGTHKTILYPVAVIKDSRNQDAAKDFVRFLFSSQEGKRIFEKHGFFFIG